MAIKYKKKKSVELTFEYLTEGCSRTLESNKRRDTPHLNSMRYAPLRHSHSYTKSECCSSVLDSLKTATFSVKDSAKNTLTIMSALGIKTLSDYKVNKFFAKRRNTHSGISQQNLKIN